MKRFLNVGLVGILTGFAAGPTSLAICLINISPQSKMYSVTEEQLKKYPQPNSELEARKIMVSVLQDTCANIMGEQEFEKQVCLFETVVDDRPFFQFITRNLPEAAKEEIEMRSQLNTSLLVAPNYFLALEQHGDASAIASAAEVNRTANSGERIVVHSILTRPGFGEFMSTLEYKHFVPGTDANDDFHAMYSCIPPRDIDGPQPVAIISVPIEHKQLVIQTLGDCGLRLIKEGHTTAVLDSTGVHNIPLTGANCHAVANIDDHEIYGADPDTQKRLHQEEDERIKQLREEAGFKVGR